MMNLQDKINWFKLNGWLETMEISPTLVDINIYGRSVPSKTTVEAGYFVAKWTGTHSTIQLTQSGDTKSEAIENLYTSMGESLWESIRRMEGYDPSNYL